MNIPIQGEPVPALGLGTWQLRGAACIQGVAHALAVGYRHIDTAQLYENETEVGRGIKQSGVPRSDIFLVTKVQSKNFAYQQVIASTQESLQKLDTEYIDLLLMHWPEPTLPLEPTLTAMQELQTQGLIRHIGLSNFSPELVKQAMRYATIFSNQVEYHPYKAQAALVQQAKAEDYLLVAYSPLAQGAIKNDATLKAIGAAHGKSPAQIALRWLLQQGVATIPKAGSDQHRQTNWDVFDFTLNDEEMKAIFGLAGWGSTRSVNSLFRKAVRFGRRSGRKAFQKMFQLVNRHS